MTHCDFNNFVEINLKFVVHSEQPKIQSNAYTEAENWTVLWHTYKQFHRGTQNNAFKNDVFSDENEFFCHIPLGLFYSINCNIIIAKEWYFSD